MNGKDTKYIQSLDLFAFNYDNLFVLFSIKREVFAW